MWPWWCVGWYNTVILSCLVSNVYFNCIVQDSLYHNMDIGTIWHRALVICTPSQSIGLFWGVHCSGAPVTALLCAPFTISLIEFYFIMIFIRIGVTIIGIFMAIFFILNNMFRLFVFWMVAPLDILLGTFGLPGSGSFMSCLHSLPYRIFYRGVPGFATDCPWRRLLYVGPLLGNLV